MKLPVNYNELEWQDRRSVRQQYVREQEGNCHYCKSPLSGPPKPSIAKKRVTPRLYPKNFFQYPVHLHHDHITGMTIGAVHAHCNAVLWEHEGE